MLSGIFSEIKPLSKGSRPCSYLGIRERPARPGLRDELCVVGRARGGGSEKDTLLSVRVIRHSDSPYPASSPLHFRKPSELRYGKATMCFSFGEAM